MIHTWELKFGEFHDLDGCLLAFGNWLEGGGGAGFECSRLVRIAKSFCVPSLMRLDLRLAQAGQVVIDGILRVEAEMFGIRADESAIEHTAGELIELLILDGLQHTPVDLGDVGNVVERELFYLARFAEFVSEFTHDGRPFPSL